MATKRTAKRKTTIEQLEDKLTEVSIANTRNFNRAQTAERTLVAFARRYDAHAIWANRHDVTPVAALMALEALAQELRDAVDHLGLTVPPPERGGGLPTREEQDDIWAAKRRTVGHGSEVPPTGATMPPDFPGRTSR